MSNSSDTSPASSERRRPKRRRRVLLSGVVVFADGSHHFDCAIRDLNESGARVLARGQKIPREFYLIGVRDRVAHDAKVIWENKGEVGVSFQDSFRLADIKDPDKHFLSRLWFDKARS